MTEVIAHEKSDWKDIAELIGILAIVASLVSVAFQLQQTQLALIAATYQARAFDAIAEGLYVADSEHLLPILVQTDHGENFDERISQNMGAAMACYRIDGGPSGL
jgi:uncharacterized metal-binding protein